MAGGLRRPEVHHHGGEVGAHPIPVVLHATIIDGPEEAHSIRAVEEEGELHRVCRRCTAPHTLSSRRCHVSIVVVVVIVVIVVVIIVGGVVTVEVMAG